MNKPKPHPEVEYIEVPERKPGGKLDLAFNILFEEVMKDRKLKNPSQNRAEMPVIEA